VTKLPRLNCCTTVKVPSRFERTVKCRSNVSVAHSSPGQVPESGEVLGQHDGALKTLAVTSAFPSVTTVNTGGSFTVQAKDAAGDVITNYTGTVTIAVNDPAAIVPVRTYTFTAADAGAHTFDLAFGTPGARTITVAGENGVVSTQTVTVNGYGLVKSLAIPTRSDQLFDPTRNQTIVTGTHFDPELRDWLEAGRMFHVEQGAFRVDPGASG